jgi:hypothetical protein
MDFKDWVKGVGGVNNAAQILGEKPRTVRSWFYSEKPPRFEAAVKIVSRTPLDFNALYNPFMTMKTTGKSE